MKTKSIEICKRFYLFIVFFVIELIVFTLRFLSFIDFELFKTLSFPFALSVTCLIEAGMTYRQNHMNRAKAALVFAIIFFIFIFL